MTYKDYISAKGNDAFLKISAIVLDIDGVLTDGRFGYAGTEDEIKFFHARDGLGIRLAMTAGLKVGVLSGRASKANQKRCRELGFSFFYEGQKDKQEAFDILLEENGLTGQEVLYIGDDIIDIPVLRKSGLAVTVADAVDYMDEICDFRTELAGGHGAVREVIEILLKEQDKWDTLLEKYLG